MITNTGKNIIAKYLIGDAPAYASYIALGCGSKPRLDEYSLYENVTLLEFDGTLINGESDSQIIDINYNTDILINNIEIYKKSGAASIDPNTIISNIDSPYSITTSSNTEVGGNIQFYTLGEASVLSLDSAPEINSLWIGAEITLTWTDDQQIKTHTAKIISINPGTSFTISPGILSDDFEGFKDNSETEIGNTITMTVNSNSQKEELDFEMFRIPISSRGYANDSGNNKIILTAQLPTEERYEISEVGIYSAGSNAAAGQYDSKTLLTFSNDENWQLFVESSSQLFGSAVGSQYFAESNVSLINNEGNMIIDPLAIKTDSVNGIFTNAERSARYERPRFLRNVILLRSDSSYIFPESSYKKSKLEVYDNSNTNYLQLNGVSLDLTKNSPSDLIKTAFSLIAKNLDESNIPDAVRIIIQFVQTNETVFAQLELNISNFEYNFENNRYIVTSSRLDDLIYTLPSTASWKNVSAVKIYASAINKIRVTNKTHTSGTTTLTLETALPESGNIKIFNVDNNINNAVFDATISSETNITFLSGGLVSTGTVDNGYIETVNDNFYIAFDALRIDNVSTINPLYGLTGYSVIQNEFGETVTKSPNTNNYIEYRFALDVN